VRWHQLVPGFLPFLYCGVLSANLLPTFADPCGELSFCHRLPFDRSSVTRWRQRLGRIGDGAAAPEKLWVLHKTGALAPKDLERVAVGRDGTAEDGPASDRPVSFASGDREVGGLGRSRRGSAKSRYDRRRPGHAVAPRGRLSCEGGTASRQTRSMCRPSVMVLVTVPAWGGLLAGHIHQTN
jgi:hypothetical protein